MSVLLKKVAAKGVVLPDRFEITQGGRLGQKLRRKLKEVLSGCFEGGAHLPEEWEKHGDRNPPQESIHQRRFHPALIQPH